MPETARPAPAVLSSMPSTSMVRMTIRDFISSALLVRLRAGCALRARTRCLIASSSSAVASGRFARSWSMTGCRSGWRSSWLLITPYYERARRFLIEDVRRMRDDDFERLYEAEAQGLFGFLAYRTGDRALAEDLLADTFERALRSRSASTAGAGRPKTWLYAIALNLLRDHARRAAAEERALERAGPARGGGRRARRRRRAPRRRPARARRRSARRSARRSRCASAPS